MAVFEYFSYLLPKITQSSQQKPGILRLADQNLILFGFLSPIDEYGLTVPPKQLSNDEVDFLGKGIFLGNNEKVRFFPLDCKFSGI